MVHAFIIEPDTYIAFEDEAEQIKQCKEWGLLSEKATKTKAFFYKGNGMNLPCSIVGYVDEMTAVIEFDNKERHCIHPSYLKEMQASNYGQRLAATTEVDAEDADAETGKEEEKAPPVKEVKLDKPKAVEPPKAKAKKEKALKPQLPEEKVKMTATVKEFTTVPNNFTEEDDEVIIYETVFIVEPEMEIGEAWSSHSATLKKLELEIGDALTFEAKIVQKKLTRHPVKFKINNPSKIQKAES